MKCKSCGYINTNDAEYCIHCGVKLNPTMSDGLDAYPRTEGLDSFSDIKQKTSSFAIIGLLMSITSLWNAFVYSIVGLLISTLGFIFSLIGIIQVAVNKQKGKDLAIAGLIISISLIILTVYLRIKYYNFLF